MNFKIKKWWIAVTAIVGGCNVVGSALSLMSHNYFLFGVCFLCAIWTTISVMEKIKGRRAFFRQQLLDDFLSDSKPH